MFNHRLHYGQNEEPKYQEFSSCVNEAFANALLPKLHEGILLLNLEGRFEVANDAALRMFKIDAKHILFQQFWDVFADDHLGFSMREALRYGISHRLIYKSFSQLELEISTCFLYEGPKAQRGLLICLRDITEKLKLQQIAARTDRMRELGELAGKLAHEIRNCLGSIRGFSSLLFRDLLHQPHLQEMIGKVIEGAKALDKLVSAVLVYARPLQLLEQTVDLSHFLKQVARALKVDPSLPSNIKIALHIPDDPILVPIDADALKRALLNLLLNAVQAMPKGGELTFSMLKFDTTCQISISDEGVGISEEHQRSLFAPFFTTKRNGNGLGLVETKKIIQAHGGTIEIRSALGRGATFLVNLPLKR